MENKMMDVKPRILSAAESLFAEKGFDGVSVEEIAKKAEANKSLIYYYFSSKEGLLAGIMQKQLSEFDSIISKIEIKPERDIKSIVEELISLSINYVDTHEDLVKIMQMETLLNLKSPKLNADIITFINPLIDKIIGALTPFFPDSNDISFMDKVICISLIINYISIKERINSQDLESIEEIKNMYIKRITDIIMLIAKKNKEK